MRLRIHSVLQEGNPPSALLECVRELDQSGNHTHSCAWSRLHPLPQGPLRLFHKAEIPGLESTATPPYVFTCSKLERFHTTDILGKERLGVRNTFSGSRGGGLLQVQDTTPMEHSPPRAATTTT